MFEIDYDECQKQFCNYILFPAIQGLVYVKKCLCPDEDILESPSDTFEVIEANLIGNDEGGKFTHSINDKHLGDISKGMNVEELTKILCYLEDIQFETVEYLTVDYIHNGEYVSREYKIETGSDIVI